MSKRKKVCSGCGLLRSVQAIEAKGPLFCQKCRKAQPEAFSPKKKGDKK